MTQPPTQLAGVAGAAPESDALRNLMVNYIPTTIDEMQLRQLFEMYGPIESIKIVCDRETRQSKGYGFVKYRFSFSAMHAIQYLNGYPLMNKRLKVAYANQAEAQKAAQNQSEQTALNPYGVFSPAAVAGAQGGVPTMPGAEDPNQALWLQQMNYMQQVAALQMMQYQQMMMMNQATIPGGQGVPGAQGQSAQPQRPEGN
jgi:RNA recognition motif-containing protein